MLVHVKTPLTEIEIKGIISDHLLKTLKSEFGKNLDISNEEEYINPFETEWYKSEKENMFPGDYLRIDRENMNLTQSQLGQKIGTFSRQYISDLENNRKNISLKVAKKLAKIFERSVDRYL